MTDYWKKRIKQEQLIQKARDAELGKEMSSLYRSHFVDISKEITSFLEHYANKNGLSYQEAMKRVEQFDVQAFQDKARRYVEARDFSPQANQELALYNLKMKMNRLELLKANLTLELAQLESNEMKLTERFLKDEVRQTLKQQAGLLGHSVASQGTLQAVAQARIKAPFEGATWSRRIWNRQTVLRQQVDKITQDLVIRGVNPTTAISQLRRTFDVTAHQAKRLAVTEGARIQTEVQREMLKQAGFEMVEYITEPSACRICAPHSGKHYRIVQLVPGLNAPPMHPFCRCSIAAWEDSAKSVDNISDKVYNESVDKLDLMAKSQLYTVGDRIRVSAKQVQGTEYDFWVQDNTKKIRDTVSNVTEVLRNLEGNYKIPRIVFVKHSRLNAFAGYNQAQDVLFISDILHSKEEVSKLLADNYFAATDIEGVLKHELTHKRHWDSARAFYRANKKRYGSLSQAKNDLDSSLINYVKQQSSYDFNYVLRISSNADEAFILGNINELVAEVSVLGDNIDDKDLLKKVKEVLSWK